MDNYSLADIRAATHDNDNDEFGGGWFWIVVLFLFMFGFGGNGMWGNRNNAYEHALTRSDMCEEFNFNNLQNAVRGVQNGICDSTFALNNTITNGNAATQMSLTQGFSGVNAALSENRFAQQQCCCETNRNIDASRYDAQKNTCDITTAIHAEGEATRALINSNTMQNLRDKLADRDRELQTANFHLSQQAQNATLINELRPCARPAYITCSPYESSRFGNYNYNNGCGCGHGCA